MTVRYRGVVVAVVAAAMTALAIPAQAQAAPPGNGNGNGKGVGGKPDVMRAVETFEYSKNLKPMGYSPRVVPFTGAGSGSFNTDLAFSGDLAVQGTYAGFRIVDISSPANPKELVNWEECVSAASTTGNQGDVIVYGDLVIRSWNSPTPATGAMCGDWQMAPGEEGVHVIDISDPANPEVIAFVDTPCGSHTETLVPDLENNRLLVYSNSSSGGRSAEGLPCGGWDIVEIPLDDPAAASYLRYVPTGTNVPGAAGLYSCHDTSVILGDVDLAACAGSNGVNVFDISDPANPVWLYYKVTGGIGVGHSAAFTPDGEVLVVSHEPGGGGQARCGANEQEYALFFLDARTGESLGQYTFPRPQGPTENCTVHNYNIVPTDKGYILVAGSYQSGISVVDFTDPANAVEIAYADPAPLDPNTLVLGGDWSTYYYNGFIYQSDIRRGLIVWRLNDPAVAGAKKLNRLNPQTTEQTL